MFKKLNVKATLLSFVIMGVLILNGCAKKSLTNEYTNYHQTGNSLSAGAVISEDSVKQVEAFSNDLAVLPESFKNAFDMTDTKNVGELLLVNDDTNEIIYSMNSMKERAPASTTKLLTAYITLMHCDMNDMVTVKHNITLESGAVALYLMEGDQISVKNLLYALLLESANDCAVVLAEHISGSVDEFAKLMNKTANQLGATHSHFKNPHGLDAKGHYSCAYDLYLFLKNDLEIEEFREIVATSEYTVSYLRNGETINTDVKTTNHYLTNEVETPTDFTIIGGKTGTTTNAGHCLTLSAYNDKDQQIIGIVLNSTDVNSLYTTMSELITENYAYTHDAKIE